MKAGIWQRTAWPVRLTFHAPPARRAVPHPLDPVASADTRAAWRRDRFGLWRDPRLPGEVVLRGLKEGA